MRLHLLYGFFIICRCTDIAKECLILCGQIIAPANVYADRLSVPYLLQVWVSPILL